jgi:hypothetical protein
MLIFLAVGPVIVMLLWNWLVPVIFGLKTIDFWQALGLLVLAKILFGGLGFHHRRRFYGPPRHWKHGGHHWGKWHEEESESSEPESPKE